MLENKRKLEILKEVEEKLLIEMKYKNISLKERSIATDFLYFVYDRTKK